MSESLHWSTGTLSDLADGALQAGLSPAIPLAFGLTAAVGFLMLLGLVLIYAERKVAAHFQCRLGPMRVGWHGVLQSVADALKLLLKEDVVPRHADRLLHVVAPAVVMLSPLLALALLPLAPWVQGVDFPVGLVFICATTGFGVFGILLGGWASNNKWSLLGAMRAGAQILSYELSATLCMLVAGIFSGSLSLADIVQSQQKGWWLWRGHLACAVAFVIFLIASVAELNRTPFDLPEGESELAAGFHTEYSGLRFGFFFLAEFINVFIAAAVAATLFLGGWMPFHLGDWAGFNALMDLIPPAVWFTGKTCALVFIIMWFRWTFPRLRIDQLMQLEWKILLPIGLVNLLLSAALVVSGGFFFPG